MPTTRDDPWEQRSNQGPSDQGQPPPGATAQTDTESDASTSERQIAAEAKVKRAMWYGGAAGILPLPLVDLALISGVQIKLIADISELYDIPFSKHVVRSSIAALVGGVVPVSGLSTGSASMVKAVPFVGPLIGLAVAPAFAAATTWAVGKVFIAHFESGGTLLDFSVSKARQQFQDSFNRASSES